MANYCKLLSVAFKKFTFCLLKRMLKNNSQKTFFQKTRIEQHCRPFIFDSNILGYIDVGDICWSQNVWVTIIWCWWGFLPFRSPTSNIKNSGTNIDKSSPTLSREHHDLTNITKSPTSWCHQHHCHQYFTIPIFPQMTGAHFDKNCVFLEQKGSRTYWIAISTYYKVQFDHLDHLNFLSGVVSGLAALWFLALPHSVLYMILLHRTTSY